MKPFSVNIDASDTEENMFKVVVSYHERDSGQRFGRAVDVIVYIERDPQASQASLKANLQNVSRSAVEKAREFLGLILAGD